MTASRPKWNDPEVQQAAVIAGIASVADWARASIPAVDLSSEESQMHLRAVVTLAVQESADAYGAGRYLETFMEWPVDAMLFRALDTIYSAMPKEADKAVHAWVMKERVRFKPVETNFVKFKIGPVDMQGTVVAVIAREARGIVEVKTGPGKTKNVSVNAEDIVSFTKGITKPTGGNNPTGGTPIAARGGAILKEAKAA
jgi:hypothetical protein